MKRGDSMLLGWVLFQLITRFSRMREARIPSKSEIPCTRLGYVLLQAIVLYR